MGIKFSNNASANIVRALTPTATSVSVTPDKGDLFPSLTEGDYFYATLAGNNGLEIVKVINRVNDTMTIVRAQDDTTALSFDTGDLFELRIVAADFNDTFSEVNDKLEASLSSKAPIFHASSSDEFGTGTSTEYGHNKLSDATDSNLGADSGTAATPKAVKTAKAEAVTTATKALTAFAETQAAKDAEQDAVIGTIREDTVAAAQEAASDSAGESGTVTLEGVASEVARLSAALGGLGTQVGELWWGHDPKSVTQLEVGKAETDLSNLSTAGRSLASSLGMPSARYIDLTFGAEGTQYTAPANGYFMFRKRLGASMAQYIGLENMTKSYLELDTLKGDTGNEMSVVCPATKGDIIRVWYTANGITEAFRFFYAEGEEA